MAHDQIESVPNNERLMMSKLTSAMRELSVDELDVVSGGDPKIPEPSSRDRRKAGLDNIQKILDILHGMNTQI